MSFPQVGASAVLLGAAQFNQQANQVVNNLVQITQAAQRLERESGAAFGGFGKAFAGAAIGTGVLLGLREIVDVVGSISSSVLEMGASFEYAFAQTSASLEASAQDLKSLQDEIVNIAEDSATAINEITRGTGDLIRAGVNIEDAIGGAARGLNDFVDAAAGEVSTVDAANLAATVMNATGEDATDIFNVLTGAVVKTAASYNDIVTGGAQASSTMVEMGYNALDLATILGIMNAQGIRGGRAGASVKAFLLGLQNPSKEAAKYMREFGISLYDTEGNMVSMEEVFRRLEAAFGDAAKASGEFTEMELANAKGAIFTGDAIRTANVAILEGAEGYARLKAEIAGVDVSTIADKVRDALVPQFQALQNTIAGIIITFTEQFLPTMTTGVQIVKELLQALDPAIPAAFGAALAQIMLGGIGAMPDFTTLLGPGAGEAINEIITILLTLRETIVMQIIPSVVQLAQSFLTLIGAASSQQSALSSMRLAIEYVGTAISKTILFVAALFQALSRAPATINAVIIVVKSLGAALLVGLAVAAGIAAVAVISAFGAILGPAALVAGVVFVIVTAWQIFPEAMNSIVTAVLETIVAFVNAHIQMIVLLAQIVSQVWAMFWNFMLKPVVMALTSILTMLTQFVGSVVPGFAQFANAVLATWNGLWNGMDGIAYRAISYIIRQISRLVGAIPGLQGFGFLGNLVANLIEPPPAIGVGGVPVGPQTIFEGSQLSGIGKITAGISDAIGSIGDAWTEVTSDFNGFLDEMTSGFPGIYREVDKVLARLKYAEEMRKRSEAISNLHPPVIPEPGLPIAPGFIDPAVDDALGKAGKGGKAPGSGSGGGAGGKQSAAEQLQEIKNHVADLLKDLPGLTQELVDFLAGLEQATAGRLSGMVEALLASRDLIGQMLVAKLQMVAASAEMLGVEKRIAAVESQLAIIEAQERIAMIPYERQLLALRQQILAIDIQMVPYRRELLQIDYQISQLQKTDYATAQARAKLDYEALPIRYRLRDLEQEITDITDKRLALTRREAEIRGELASRALSAQMKSNSSLLEAAWGTMDVPEILRLEEQKAVLEEQQKAADEQMSTLRDQIEETRLLDELKSIGLQHEKIDIEEVLRPLDRKIELLDREVELATAFNEIALTGLQAQRQAIEDILGPMELQKALLESQRDLVDMLRQQEANAFAARKLEYEALKALELLRQAELKETMRVQSEVLQDLVLKFAGALESSDAFTVGEAFEVAKRMKLWDDQIAKIAEIAAEFSRVRGEVDKLSEAIKGIPRDVHINITTTTSGSGSGGDVASYEHGGTVPGPYGAPQLAIVHGGEHFLGLGRSKPMAAQMAESTSISNANTTSSHTQYNDIDIAVPPSLVSTGGQRQVIKYLLQDILSGSRR